MANPLAGLSRQRRGRWPVPKSGDRPVFVACQASCLSRRHDHPRFGGKLLKKTMLLRSRHRVPEVGRVGQADRSRACGWREPAAAICALFPGGNTRSSGFGDWRSVPGTPIAKPIFRAGFGPCSISLGVRESFTVIREIANLSLPLSGVVGNPQARNNYLQNCAK